MRVQCKIKNNLWTGSSMVEQLTLNQRVGGSSPPRFTKSSMKMRFQKGSSFERREPRFRVNTVSAKIRTRNMLYLRHTSMAATGGATDGRSS
jgi:hypothetical protein